MKVLILSFSILLFCNILFAQSHFSVEQYFANHPEIEDCIDFNQQEDRAKLETLVNDLIVGGDFEFPDLYTEALSYSDSNWPIYPELIMWNTYYSYVAFSIYLDYGNKLTWKLSELPKEELDFFFDMRRLVDSTSPAYRSTPTSPVITYKFLLENNLIGSTRRETIKRLLQWCRYHMSHFTGAFTPENAYNHWQFYGYPPIDKIINGTKKLEALL